MEDDVGLRRAQGCAHDVGVADVASDVVAHEVADRRDLVEGPGLGVERQAGDLVTLPGEQQGEPGPLEARVPGDEVVHA